MNETRLFSPGARRPDAQTSGAQMLGAPTPAVAVRGLRKSFGDHVVLDAIDLDVAEGSVFALLGPNGAGKTTTVRILATLLAPDSGTAEVDGCNVASDPGGVRAAIGVTGQFSAVDSVLTGEENLRLMADLRHLGKQAGQRRVAELLDQFDLVDAAKNPVSTYSGGMRRKLDLAMTLVGAPRIVFLDEPTAGLDPRSRRTMWEIVTGLVAAGVTIFLTTQYLEEADHLADRIAVLDNGRIVAEGTPSELKRLVPGGHVRMTFTDPSALHSAAQLLDGSIPDEDLLALVVPGETGARTLTALLGTLHAARIDVEELSIHSPDLDDVFLALTSRENERRAS